ncbi:cell division protein ZapC [Veronia nyctiphanis]|uniref:Cell division protein ZapC n=1 Tax=Veronia nyctiphanis TaxID=1278244 RepID=A0A4Q0YYK6_9GAMM|nr:cell division protein ZapC [Veronia nyctiphanis]RXJ74299.1 cell division protein ZapC [Veronia nyctiphanis]
MLKPNSSWKWYFDTDTDSLMLELGQDMVFKVAIASKHLIPDAFMDIPFSVDDASLFHLYSDGLTGLSLSGPRKAELVLNAVAANRFHKPLLPKSWFFQDIGGDLSPETGSIVELKTETGKAPFLVIENSGAASLCMLAAEADLALTGKKNMVFCEAIKVMNDRLCPYQNKQDKGKGRYALVG